MPKAPAIRDRIIDFVRVPANQLVPNSKNYRLHNDAQRTILRQLLDDIGFAGAELVRRLPDGRYGLIDGHLRAEEMGTTPLPVLVTDLSAEEADVLLATYDPLGRLAGVDQDAAQALIESLGVGGHDAAADLLTAIVNTDQTAALLEALADGMLGADDESKRRGNDLNEPAGGSVESSYGVLVECSDESEQQRVYELVKEQGFSCRVLTL